MSEARIDRTAWLGPGLLLIAGTFGAVEDLGAVATLDDHETDLDTTVLATVPGDEGGPARTLLAAGFGSDERPFGVALPIVLRGSADREQVAGADEDATSSPSAICRLDADEAAETLIDPTELFEQELGGLRPRERRAVLGRIADAAAPQLQRAGGFALARKMARARSVLRPALPLAVLDHNEPTGAHLDSILAVDAQSFWFRGWLHDGEQSVTHFAAVSPEGAITDLLDGAYRYHRPDVAELYRAAGHADRGERHGFVRFRELRAPSLLSEGWLLEVATPDGLASEKPVFGVVRDPAEVRTEILSALVLERPGRQELMRAHVHPAISRIQEPIGRGAVVEDVVQFGEAPKEPRATIVVPLYQRFDFLEHQLAHFAYDPEIAASDLVYVLDSPEQADEVLEFAWNLHILHAVPFRLAVMRCNAGFSGANNAAAGLARGARLLLLNSDVIPDRPGWLGRMIAFHDATPDIGALGPKLLYEDDSLQHAGLYFRREPPGVWGNQHYFKGLHRYFPAANLARPVPAVTGACMMVDRSLYEAVGGLPYGYVQGGYEDSDFCLRLIERGLQNWYMPGAELYHLEAQSYPAEFRKRATAYNIWLHTHLWGDQIEEVSASYPGPGEPAA